MGSRFLDQQHHMRGGKFCGAHNKAVADGDVMALDLPKVQHRLRNHVYKVPKKVLAAPKRRKALIKYQ